MLEPERTYTAAELIDIGLSRVAALGRFLDDGTATPDDYKELESWIELLPAIRVIKNWGEPQADEFDTQEIITASTSRTRICERRSFIEDFDANG
jgi:hypothetical protein